MLLYIKYIINDTIYYIIKLVVKYIIDYYTNINK